MANLACRLKFIAYIIRSQKTKFAETWKHFPSYGMLSRPDKRPSNSSHVLYIASIYNPATTLQVIWITNRTCSWNWSSLPAKSIKFLAFYSIEWHFLLPLKKGNEIIYLDLLIGQTQSCTPALQMKYVTLECNGK